MKETEFEDVKASEDTSSLKSDSGNKADMRDMDSSDEDQKAPTFRKKRIQLLPDSDSDTENLQNVIPKPSVQNISDDSNNRNDMNILKRVSQNSKSSSCSSSDEKSKNEDMSRIKSKRNKLMQKFKGLLKSRAKDNTQEQSGNDSETKQASNENSESSDYEENSVERIRQIIKEQTNHLKSTLYDTDTSAEESTPVKKIKKSHKPRKSTILTSPKPTRMSAKQAMENMKKIKSESNRMLREKEVSLPYHRPKALSLKDIMSRRRPAMSADGKVLSVKMNEEQLKQYALSLEQRQKEVIELCKSDTEDEEEQPDQNNETSEETQTKNDTIYDSILNSTNDSEKQEDINSFNNGDTQEDIGDNKAKFDGNDTINDEILEKQSNNDSESQNLPGKENLDVSEEAKTKEDDIVNTTVTNDNNSEETENIIPEDNFKNVSNNTEEIEKTMIREKRIEEGNESAEMSLVYNSADNTGNDSLNKDIEENTELVQETSKLVEESKLCEENNPQGTEESQLISLHYEHTEKMDSEGFDQSKQIKNGTENMDVDDKDEFSDNDEINMDDIDNLIENAEILSQNVNDINSPMLINDRNSLRIKPTLMGAPGMVIDLDGTDACLPKKTGVELLKERFTFFAKLKTPDEMEREKDKRNIPGAQHLKLKHDLEEQIAEQRSLEWSKRLEEEKQHQKEMDTIRGEDSDNDLDAIEAKLAEREIGEEIGENNSSNSSSEGELEENDVEIKDKPRKSNPMLDDEAEEDSCDENGEKIAGHGDVDSDVESQNGDVDGANDDADGDVEDNDEICDDSKSEESSEDEEIEYSKPKKGRILKAFEDSDDETPEDKETEVVFVKSQNQDEEIQLAQRQKSYSEDLFTSQESTPLCTDKILTEPNSEERDLGTQTFSILNSATTFKCPDNLDAIDNSQNLVEANVIDNETPDTQKSQEIGEDLLSLCTGKFYDNQFVSQLETNKSGEKIPLADDTDRDSQESNFYLDVNEKNTTENNVKNNGVTVENDTTNEMHTTSNNESGMIVEINTTNEIHKTTNNEIQNEDIDVDSTTVLDKDDTEKQTQETTILNSILDELNEPEPQKVNRYFTDNSNEKDGGNTQLKKKFVIDSDDEGDTERVVKTKKIKKKKLEQRALQISDDEEEDQNETEDELAEDLSEPEEEGDRLVEYDSEENEVEIQQPKKSKSKKLGEFFENEAELTSEDEWMGSGDEDERGLDTLEREAGDDDTFSQKRLMRELGQIHMREVLDQDKREVRLIQELLFEDGDLGDGHRQRKFRWKDADTENGETPSLNILDSQEEEFESEEQWRKQRHEREMFLRQLKEKDKEELENTAHVAFNRTSMIKASLSKTSTNVIVDVNTSETEVAVKKTKDIPSPKKPFTLQQNYHNSLLARGRGALERLAALATPLATPLAGDEDKLSLHSASNRNFVFAALTPDTREAKKAKRKAEVNIETPRLVKKMKSEEQSNRSKSLLDLM